MLHGNNNGDVTYERDAVTDAKRPKLLLINVSV